jgi:glycosyltransferase involved in cell wall biosynthesis
MKKNILHVVNVPFVIPYFFGEQINYFSSNGFNVFIACSFNEKINDYIDKWCFRYVNIKISRKVTPLQDLISVYKLVLFIKRNDIDIIVGHTPKGALLGIIAGFIAGKHDRIYFRHGLMFETSKGIKRKILINFEKITGKLASKVICVSNSVQNNSVLNKLNNPKKNLILHKGTCNGIDVEKFNREHVLHSKISDLKNTLKINSNDKIIGFVGRIVKDKGIIELLDAWKKLKTKYSNIKLLLVGPFEQRDSIGTLAQEYILNEESIIYIGLSDSVIQYYQLMDIFILPSYREGFPTVVLEASSMSLPIIVSRSTGCIDSIIENNTGIYTEINAEQISKNLSFYLDNPKVAIDHGKNGRDFVISNFKQELIWEELLNKVFN